MRINLLDRKMRVAATLLFVAVAFIVDIGMRAYAQQQKKAEAVKRRSRSPGLSPPGPLSLRFPESTVIRKTRYSWSMPTVFSKSKAGVTQQSGKS